MNNKKFYVLLTVNLLLVYYSFRLIVEYWRWYNWLSRDSTLHGFFLWVPIIILSIYLYRNAPPKK